MLLSDEKEGKEERGERKERKKGGKERKEGKEGNIFTCDITDEAEMILGEMGQPLDEDCSIHLCEEYISKIIT